MFKEYSNFYDMMNSDKDYKGECEFVYQWADKPKTILDLGCGTASYWKYFPAKMTGIEKSADMIKRSKHRERIIQADIIDTSFNIFNKDFNCITALFDVINYLPKHNFWKWLPIKKGGFFIFDMWNKDKVDKDGFKVTVRQFGSIKRIIIPDRKGNKVKLVLVVQDNSVAHIEHHTMYLYSEHQIKKFCGKEFKLVDKKQTDSWQTFYRLQRR